MNKILTFIVISASTLLIAGSAIAATATSVNRNASAIETISASGNIVDCFSQSEIISGQTYYDCGSCKMVINAKGKGSKRTCVANEGTIVIIINPGTDPRIQ